MENIMVDSCVFFKMIEFNNFVKKYGAESLDDYLKMKCDKLEKLKKEIESVFFDEFLEKYKGKSFDELVELYRRDYSLARVNHFKRESKKNLQLSKGYVNVNGQKRKMNFSEDKKQKHYNKYLEYKEYEKITPYEAIKDLYSSYKHQKDIFVDGLIYKKALDGEYKLFTNFISYDEILNHTIEHENENWLYYTPEEVIDLSKHFSLVTASDEKVLEDIDKLALAYRTPNDELLDKEMAEDINSVGEYGDSKIAAIANMSGMTLITQNGKDFIFNNEVDKFNDYIKRHLKNQNKQFDFTTDASVYYPEELWSENYKKPNGINNVYSLKSINETHSQFDSKFEIAL